MTDNNICVIHLIRASNEIGSLKMFLESYTKHPAGLKHDLLFILKGFEENKIPDEIESLLNQYTHQRINVPDEGFDIGQYIAVARFLEHDYLCFFNSFSEILDDNWLEKLYRYASLDGCGMASATGSFESYYSSTLMNLRSRGLTAKFSLKYWIEFFSVLKMRTYFLPFPNPHLRTNGFCISKTLFREVTRGDVIKEKHDTFLFESGKNGLSRRIASRGLRLIVVGRDGRGFYQDEWSVSNTFRQDEQKNLLVADNQTRKYYYSDICMRKKIMLMTWEKN